MSNPGIPENDTTFEPTTESTESSESFDTILSQFEQTHSHRTGEGGKQLSGTVVAVSAEFVFVEPNSDPATQDGHTFDMRGAEYSHEGDKCTFQVIVERHNLSGDAGLVEMGRIIRDADVPPSRTRRHEAAGLDALIRGFQLSVPDDHEKLLLTLPL